MPRRNNCMGLFSAQTNIIIPKSISATLVAVMVLNSLFFALIFYPQKAEAQFTDPVNAVLQPIQINLDAQMYALQGLDVAGNKVSQAKTGLFEIWDQFKSNNGVVAELVSSLLLIMMHQVLAKMTNDIVAWINGGGKGKIRVLQDPGKFLADALDEAGGVLAGAILNVDPATLCDASYLKFKLKAAFTGPYAVPTFDEKVACTFTGAAAGLQKFQEDFRNGGWASFIELSRKENNQIGQTLIIAEEMAKIKSEKSAESVAKLNISKGFLAQEKCTITKVPATNYSLGSNFDGDFNTMQASDAPTSEKDNGRPMEEVMEKYGITDAETFKTFWRGKGGDIACKTVTPAEQISQLATTALQAPIKRLEDSITGLTSKLGTGAGSVIKPYVLAIAGAGLNLLLNKEIGLITNALASAKKPRKARRQTTSSLQENTMLAQSAGALAASMNDFRSFLLKAMLEFSLYVSNATTALNKMDVLGRIPINIVETETRKGTWYLGGGCPSGYQNSGINHFCNTTAPDPNAVATSPAGKTFFEEANWCGAYYQEIPIVTEGPLAVVTPPIIGADPIPLTDLAGSCPTLTYFSGSATGNCADPSWVKYNLDGDADFEMATRIVGYDDNQDDAPDRFIRQNIVGADANDDGVPDATISALDPAYVNFSETLIDTRRDANHNSILDSISTSTPAILSGTIELFEMRPNYANTVIDALGATVTTIPQGLAQATVADDYIFGGYNQFGHSSKVFRLSTGTVFASLPIAISGSVAVYYPPNKRIYLFGGFDASQSYSTIWEFNPTNKTLRTMSARLPVPASGIAAAYYSPNGRIYLFGGNNDGAISDQILEYNQATDTLVAKAAKFPDPVAFATAATSAKDPPTNKQQRIYIFGGIMNNGFSSNAVFEYNPDAADDTSALTRKSTNIEARGFLAAALLTANTITLIGGQSEYGLLAAVEQYNAQTDSLTQMPLLAEPRSKGAGGAISNTPILAGGISPAGAIGNSKIFPEGDIYHIPAVINGEDVTTPFWQKYFSAKFEDGSTTLLNTRTEVSYGDFTATIGDPAITTITNTDANLVWMSPPFYPELFEKIQELMEKTRIISGYNYPATGVKNYQSGLADQLGATPDDDPYDNNPSNPAYRDDASENQEGYKGSVTDVLNKYNNLTQTYQTLFAGLTDENALEGVDKDMSILSPTETNIKFALIGSRCPATPPSETSSPDLIAKCPKFGDEYNMARRFIFEADDTGANPQGITTGFATNPFTGEKSSALAGILNLDEMTTQLQALPPDKNIIKLIRLRQALEQLQVWKSTDPSSPDYQKSNVRIPVLGKANTFIEPLALTGVDTISISLPGYEKIANYLNATSTIDTTGAVVPDKNRSIQTLIEDYGYATAKEAYPEISKQLDEIFDDILSQVMDDLKETFLKRIEEQLEEARVIAQHRLHRFIEYVRDINGSVKLEMSKQRGDQLAGLSGADVVQIDAESSVLRVNTEDMFVNNGQRINVLLSRSPLRLTNDERSGIIGSAIYKIKTIAKFMGIDTTTAEFSTRMSQYTAPSGTTTAERDADLDRRVKNALKDVYMYYTGTFSQTDETLSPQKRNIVSSCGQDDIMGYYCDLTTFGANQKPVRIFKDARTKLEELQNDFSLMVEETSKVSEEYRTLMANISSQKNDLDELVKLLSNLHTDYDQGNACVGLPTDAANLWSPTSAQSATLKVQLGDTTAGIITSSVINTALSWSIIPGIGTVIGAAIGWFTGKSKKKKAREEAERREAERQAMIQKCKEGITNYNKHLGQLADQFICNKTNPKYE